MKEEATASRKVEKSFRKVEAKPDNPACAEEFVQPLEVEEEAAETARYRLNIDGEMFYVGAVRVDGQVHVVFRNHKVTSSLFGEPMQGEPGLKIHVDGSFGSNPMMFVQLLLFGTCFRENMYGAYMVLMTRRKTEDYKAVFNFIKEQHPHMEVDGFMTDFERALRNGLSSAWPQVPQHGCWSHYARRIDRITSCAPLRAMKAENDNGKLLVQMVSCLPLLPTDLIQRGLDEVVWPFVAGLELEPARRVAVEALLRHVETYWLGTVGTAALSVFDLKRRTNNDAESWNGYLKREAGGIHLNPWEFVDILSKVEHRDACDFERAYLHHKKPRRDPSRKNRETAKVIQEAWKTLKDSDQETEDLRRFLRHMAHRMASFLKRSRLVSTPPPPAATAVSTPTKSLGASPALEQAKICQQQKDAMKPQVRRGKTNAISDRHKKSLKILPQDVAGEHPTWRVTAATDSSRVYTVTRTCHPYCCCIARCFKCCLLCGHMYTCTCPDVNSLCKHVHAVFRKGHFGSSCPSAETEEREATVPAMLPPCTPQQIELGDTDGLALDQVVIK
ncbi:Methionyl-tRNA formyltransferase [Frankliniella fusca]|uniref:Methionyl-tRNA formyltransferase n=1 Tax=Frankliniella fusca TaxID=407009 RepID=A0AAE1LRW6_9NEOP|nr:Methionyl-tRNA formyltransferase [Frankliniella fusca]